MAHFDNDKGIVLSEKDKQGLNNPPKIRMSEFFRLQSKMLDHCPICGYPEGYETDWCKEHWD